MIPKCRSESGDLQRRPAGKFAMHAVKTEYTVELANGQLIEVDACPMTGLPLVNGRKLPRGPLPAFSEKNPPKAPSQSREHDGVALGCR